MLMVGFPLGMQKRISPLALPDLCVIDMAIEPMEFRTPEEVEVLASGVPVGILKQQTEFEYKLKTHQKVCLYSFGKAMELYMAQKGQTLTNIFETENLHVYTIITE
jgi:hypothetical protein